MISIRVTFGVFMVQWCNYTDCSDQKKAVIPTPRHRIIDSGRNSCPSPSIPFHNQEKIKLQIKCSFWLRFNCHDTSLNLHPTGEGTTTIKNFIRHGQKHYFSKYSMVPGPSLVKNFQLRGTVSINGIVWGTGWEGLTPAPVDPTLLMRSCFGCF